MGGWTQWSSQARAGCCCCGQGGGGGITRRSVQGNAAVGGGIARRSVLLQGRAVLILGWGHWIGDGRIIGVPPPPARQLGCRARVCAPAGGNVYVDAPRPGRIYLPGSFNPLHDGHKEMLQARASLPCPAAQEKGACQGWLAVLGGCPGSLLC